LEEFAVNILLMRGTGYLDMIRLKLAYLIKANLNKVSQVLNMVT
jgi:hypothetical protein